MKKIIIILMCFVLTSCYTIDSIPTRIGMDEYAKSMTKIRKHNRMYKKYHKKETKRLDKIQKSRASNFNYEY